MFDMIVLQEDKRSQKTTIGTQFFIGAVVGGFCLLLFFALSQTQPSNTLVAELIAQNLASSGVSNPVTSVLLNFRSLDTLLEIAVLLIVALAVMPNMNSMVDHRFVKQVKNPNRNEVLEAFLRWLLPSIVVTSGYLLWTGSSLPGGAFQAGALLSGAGILLILTGSYHLNFNCTLAKLFMIFGVVVFVVVGVGVTFHTGVFLDYPTDYAGVLIFIIEAAATLSIATILTSLYHSLTGYQASTVSDSKEHIK
ncbi:hypothetical protein EAG18_13485 [Pseudoalteromonas sp. J010]|uniref:hydrogen gas-evolving membrane-bound hydrogenase subunit E n=1 Tax=Pseudoalteromonas sp. J010 TaxID=998465 RepID=UPI000F65197A|nr:hydrogen gas-evolving membrane-bound hydrogenase subunit E [Pseudoalteromonas sp. J010]RRS08184.1 hypothetical protein EAG18_13485 [Pseudoalteromonas sp. J010]